MRKKLLLTAIFSAGLAYGTPCSQDTNTSSTVWVATSCTSFTNNATIDVQEIGGNDQTVFPYGVVVNNTNNSPPLNSFTNNGSILSLGTIGNNTNSGTVIAIYGSGVYSWRPINTFTNNANSTIKIDAQAGNAAADNSRISLIPNSIYFGRQVTQVENSGSIQANVQAGSAEGNNSSVSIYGSSIGFEKQAGTVTNSGNIQARAVAGSTVGSNSRIFLDYQGLNFTYLLNELVNNPNSVISVEVRAGDAQGNGSIIQLFGRSSYFGNQVTKLTNDGTIQSKASAGSTTGIQSAIELASAILFMANRIEEIVNRGTLKSEAYGGSAVGNNTHPDGFNIRLTSGIHSDKSIGSLTNEGTIDIYSEGQSTQGSSTIYEVRSSIYATEKIDSFINNGVIKTESKVGSAAGDYSILNSFSGIFTSTSNQPNQLPNQSFQNNGTIDIKATGLNSEGVGSTLAVQPEIIFWNGVNNFKNQGNINLSAQGGDATQTGSMVRIQSGVDLKSNPNSDIENSNIIKITSNVGSAQGQNSKVEVNAYGLRGGDGGSINSMKNSGNIQVSISSGSASGIGATLDLKARGMEARGNTLENSGNVNIIVNGGDKAISNVAGIDAYVGSFTNSGVVDVRVNTGTNSNISSWAVVGTSQYQYNVTFQNSGSLINTTTAGFGSYVKAGGLAIGGGSFQEIKNEGDIIVKVIAPDANSVNISGMYLKDVQQANSVTNRRNMHIENNNPNAVISGFSIDNSNITSLSNYAFVYFDNPNPQADIRTLRLN